MNKNGHVKHCSFNFIFILLFLRNHYNCCRFFFFLNFTEATGCCIVQEVKIDNLESHISSPTKINKRHTYTVYGTMKDCMVASGTLIEWRLKNLNSSYNTSTVVSSGKDYWTIEEGSLEPSLYSLEYRAVLSSAGNVSSSSFGYLRVENSKLVAEIAGGTFVSLGYGMPITLDGSGSYDPDVGKGLYTGMVFTWLCRKTNETYENHVYLPYTNLSVIRNDGDGSSDKGGCFGTGVGKLNSTDRLLEVFNGVDK